MPKTLRSVVASVALLLVAGTPQALADPAGSLTKQPSPSATLAQLAQDVGGRGASQDAWRYSYLEKIDGHLQAIAAARLGGSVASALAAAQRQGVASTPQGAVLVDVYVNGDTAAAADRLRALGMDVTAVSSREPERMVEGNLPASAIAQAAQLGATHAIVSTYAGTNTGAVLSQGDAAIHGPQARAVGPTGAGILVGVISDSMKADLPGFNTSVANGDLPANTTSLLDSAGGEDEGRAMAEIVYDEAPGISGIVFSTGTAGTAAKVNSINNLVAAGVKVIADDTFVATEPYFQDGVISQAVDKARAAGVAYFVSAGNRARQSWEGTYSPTADPRALSPNTEDFDPSGAVDAVQTVGNIPGNSSAYVALQWAQPWGHATDDFAVDVYAISGGVPSYAFTADTNNLASGLPSEFVSVANNGGSTITYGIAIRHVAGTGTPFLKYIAGGSQTVTIEHPTNSDSIDPDAASARGALTVAASQYTTPTTPEIFSSRGPVARLFDVNGTPLAAADVRNKPELAAPDGVSTDLPGASGLNPFFGTSAASPAAAGIAALIRSAKPAMGVDELYAIMTQSSNALDCTATAGNPDADCGVGFLLADRALAMALDPTPPVVTPVLTPAAPDGANGWYRGPVTVSWSISDPESPVVGVTGCDPVSPGDATAALTCSATSAGGTSAVPLTIKRDSTAPSAPTFSGIGAKTYLPATLPKASAIHCLAADPTSGLTGCVVTGYGTGIGAHTLTATATNGAGLTTAATLRYTVAKPLAAAKLKLAKLKLAKLRASGLTLTVRVAAASTKLVVKLVATVPNASGAGTRTIVIGTLTKKNVAAGTRNLRVTLTPAGKLALGPLSQVKLKITLAASSPRAKPVSLKGSLVVKR